MPKRRSPPQPALTTTGGQLVLGARLAAFKRLYRWLNLTLVHQATWPLLVLLTTAVANEPEQTPMPWYLARLGAPVVAAFVAFVYLRRRLVGPEEDSPIPSTPRFRIGREGRIEGIDFRQQVRFLLIGLPVMVAFVRLVEGPMVGGQTSEAAAKLMLFGLADVAAYHLIHFGVVARSYPDWANGLTIATALFALSWGIHDALLTANGSSEASVGLAFLGGLVIGAVMGVLMRGLQRWPGGWLPAAATHWLLIYLIFGFAG